ncbi:sugar ABC transporter substrate-binding protein [Patescibacteria group bacterium]|nr:sugar ABC transporter substrate-binding protein [Patescibacteria group bacterium]MCL5091727.1 sugar ABC transporter substrate-binding protein [Patescibacteria group bacterium]
MDDNKTNPDQNQSTLPNRPLYEAVPVEDNRNASLTPEEVAPDVTNPEQVQSDTPSDMPPEMPADNLPPVYEDNKNQYLFIGAAIVVFLVVFFLIYKFVLSGSTHTADTKKVKLVYWGLWEDKAVFDPLIAQYQTQHPNVTIEYVKMSAQDQYREKLITRSKAGNGPDIFRFHNTWLPELKDNNQIILAPLPETVMSNQEFEKTFYPIHQKDLKIGDHYYGLPLTVDGLVLIYNQGLFKKAGIQTAPTSWTEDVLADVDKLTVRDAQQNLITSGIALGTASNIEHFSDIFGLLLTQNGGDLRKLDQPEAAQALEVYRRFAEAPTNYWDQTMPNAITAFIQEKVAMIIAPSWEVMVIKAANPDIDIRTAPVPRGPQGKLLSLANYWVEGVSRFSPNQLEAWKFLRYLVEKEQMTKLYELEAKTRFFGEPYSRVDLASTLSQHEFLGAVIAEAQSDAFISLPVISRTYDNGLNDEIVRYLENAVNATIQGVAYGDALKAAKEGVDQVLARYKIN